MRKTGLVCLATTLLASTALATSYQEIVTWDQLHGTIGATSNFAAVIDGDTSYHALSLNSQPGITKVENISGVQTTTVLVDTLTWFNATGKTSIIANNNIGVSGDYVQFGDSGTDAVWRVHTGTGALTEYVSKAQIMAYTGQTSASLLSSGDTAPNGEYTFYDSTTDSLYQTNGAGGIITLATDAELAAATGNDKVSGGLTYDAAGSLYWGNSSSDDMWKLDTGGTISSVLSNAQLVAFTGNVDSKAGFGDMFFAPDGMIYFYETYVDSILSFDPADPAGTLGYVITEADLNAGPMGGDNVVTLSWYNGNIAWHTFGTTGMYAIPEPASLLLIGLAGLLIRRR